MKRELAILLACTLSVTGCSGEVFKTFKLGDDNSVSTDARQRVVINHNPNLMTRPGTVTPARIVCVEPSPDVATVLASSVGVGLSVAGKGTASIAASSSEGLAQLAERTASIQLMRERMFRACEAYSNGAITATTYTLLMSRFDRAMVTVLFGEVMGGAFGRSLASIGSKSSSQASSSLLGAGDAIANIEDSAEALAKAEKDLGDAEKALDDEKKKDQPDAQKVEELTAARGSARGKRDATRQLLQTHVATAAKAASDATALVAAGGISTKAGAESHKQMAAVFQSFLDSNPIDDYIAACIVELERSTPDKDNAVRSYKVGLLESLNGKTLDINHGRSLSILEPFGRQSGLFEHCGIHLASLTELRERGIVSLKGYEMELRKTELLTREQEARKGETEAFGNAMEQCNKIGVSSVKAACFASVGELQKRDPKSVIAAFQDFERASTLDVNVEVLPTVMLDRVKNQITPLTNVKDRLSQLELAQVAEDQHDSQEQKDIKKKKNEEIATLVAKRNSLVEEAGKALSRATTETSDANRTELRAIENERPALRGKLQNAESELEKETQQTALRLQFLEAKQAFDKYAKLLGQMERMVGVLETHEKTMKAKAEE